MDGKTVVITGATSGVGLETAKWLAARGANIVAVGRSAEKGARAIDAITAEARSDDKVSFVLCDLASLGSVRAAAERIANQHPTIDVLINNAGLVIGKRRETVDGLEETLAVNHLAHFLLTGLLLDNVRAAPQARIINVSSDAHWFARLDFDDLQARRRYRSFRVYSNSKLANILFTRELARRLGESPVTVNALHPGFVTSNFARDNGFVATMLLALSRPFQITSRRGAETTIHLASSIELAVTTGGYFAKSKPAASSRASNDREAMQRLWEVSEALTDHPFRNLPSEA